MALKIAPNLALPDDAARWTFGFLAIKEAGKTYDAAVLAEELMKNKIPICVIDGMGIWWGLQIGVNGHQGMPVVVFGGEHGDISIPSTIGKDQHPIVDEARLRELVLAMLQSRISAVLDTTEFSKKQQRRIVTIFVEELYQRNQKYGVRHVFIEETDMWCPQRMSGEITATVGAVEDLVRRGGNFNLGCTLISQRPAVVNKDVLTQINTLVALRILADVDKKVVKTWVESVAHPNDPRIAKWYDSLKDLANGEAWIWHPETDLFKRVQFRQRETLHASREYYRLPKWEQENIKAVDVSEFVERFRKVFEPKKVVAPARLPPAPAPGQGSGKSSLSVRPIGYVRARVLKPDGSEEAIMGSEGMVSQAVKPVSGEEAPPATVTQALPSITIQQLKPNVLIPVETLDQPTSPLGRLCVVLANEGARDDRWTRKRMTEKVREHSWEDTGIEQAIDQLIRWEILKWQSNGYIRFARDRVRITEQSGEVRA